MLHAGGRGPVDPPGDRREGVPGPGQILDDAVVQVRRDLAALPLRRRQRPLQQGRALGLVPGDPAGQGHRDRGPDELQEEQRPDGERHDPQDEVVRRGLHAVVAEVDLERQRCLPGSRSGAYTSTNRSSPGIGPVRLGRDVRGHRAGIDRRGGLWGIGRRCPISVTSSA